VTARTAEYTGRMKDTIRSTRAPAATTSAPADRAAETSSRSEPPGRVLFLSGIGPRPADGGPVPGVALDDDGEVADYDFPAQVHAVFENVRAVLEDSGAALSDLVDVTVFLTDIRSDFDAFNRIYASYFEAETGPCRTTVEVNRLPTPIAIELKCVAILDD